MLTKVCARACSTASDYERSLTMPPFRTAARADAVVCVTFHPSKQIIASAALDKVRREEMNPTRYFINDTSAGFDNQNMGTE